ncbi:hypothetical protein VP06_32580 [Methylobacterium aquaticum]|uniref:Uncharacterized protein n=1 Tax=Methylobacterium aquaticum TaxID=270351 RepID=A0A0J6RWK6_9HYPH|nr:hypothetical protein VP06_32580 [Methylobacterium aquaticum]
MEPTVPPRELAIRRPDRIVRTSDRVLRRTLLVLVDSPISMPWLGARGAVEDGLGMALAGRF